MKSTLCLSLVFLGLRECFPKEVSSTIASFKPNLAQTQLLPHIEASCLTNVLILSGPPSQYMSRSVNNVFLSKKRGSYQSEDNQMHIRVSLWIKQAHDHSQIKCTLSRIELNGTTNFTMTHLEDRKIEHAPGSTTMKSGRMHGQPSLYRREHLRHHHFQ
jgi:hypothetical protein